MTEHTDELLVPVEDVEVLDERLGGHSPERRPPAGRPVVQAAAAAAGGFVAGAAVIGLVSRTRRSRALGKPRPGQSLARRTRRGGAAGGSAPAEILQIVGTRKMLVDVHLLGAPRTDA